MSRRFEIKTDYSPAGDQPEAIEKMCGGLQDGLAHQTLLGVTGSGKTFSIANVIARTQRPTLVMAPNKTLAAQFYGEMKEFFPGNAVEYFVSYYDYYQPEAYVPASDTFIEKDASVNEHIEQMRLSATKALMEREDTIIVATVSAIYGLGDPESYFSMILHLVRGDLIDQRNILRRLAELQYTRNDVELRRGTYSVRGEVIDIHPADSEREAIRVELFDEEIENISIFDPLTGETLVERMRTTIYPKSHYVTPRERVLDAVEQIKIELTGRLAELRSQNKLLEAQRLEQRALFDLEMMQELGYTNGITGHRTTCLASSRKSANRTTHHNTLVIRHCYTVKCHVTRVGHHIRPGNRITHRYRRSRWRIGILTIGRLLNVYRWLLLNLDTQIVIGRTKLVTRRGYLVKQPATILHWNHTTVGRIRYQTTTAITIARIQLILSEAMHRLARRRRARCQ